MSDKDFYSREEREAVWQEAHAHLDAGVPEDWVCHLTFESSEGGQVMAVGGLSTPTPRDDNFYRAGYTKRHYELSYLATW